MTLIKGINIRWFHKPTLPILLSVAYKVEWVATLMPGSRTGPLRTGYKVFVTYKLRKPHAGLRSV